MGGLSGELQMTQHVGVVVDKAAIAGVSRDISEERCGQCSNCTWCSLNICDGKQSLVQAPGYKQAVDSNPAALAYSGNATSAAEGHGS